MFHNIIKKIIYRPRPSCALYFTSLYLLSVHGYTKNSSALFLFWFSYIYRYIVHYIPSVLLLFIWKWTDNFSFICWPQCARPRTNRTQGYEIWHSRHFLYLVLFKSLIGHFFYYNKKVKSTFSCITSQKKNYILLVSNSSK